MKVERLLDLMAAWEYVQLTNYITGEELYIGRVEKLPKEMRTREACAMFVNENMMIRIEVSDNV